MNSSQEEAVKQIQNRIDLLKKYNEEVIILENKLERLKYAFINTTYKIEVTDDFLKVIEVLETFVNNETPVYCNIYDIENYNQFILQIYGYYHIFNNYIENRMTVPVDRSIENPRILFDPIIYKQETPTNEKKEHCNKVLNELKYIYNCIINTYDEFVFDLNFIECNNVTANQQTIQFLENVKQTMLQINN